MAGALRFAYTLTRSLALIPRIELAGTTVSAEDTQHVRHWVFCDRIMPDRSRCAQRADHDGPCGAYPTGQTTRERPPRGERPLR
ncbi:hypothetical protein C1I95_18610 [Micromonospora craterilacus]|uniref:Uncharacterized protein n=1 Tax=Micromonospora craterilacus TaxID=1655439 RepID=A0A2W2FLJ3_9ACTN|nr:hypothetical protein [Micromonospora craterilacus]PZG15954.1 hypothetical protein C1I95_18610 [Micromonospora craterilacus]